MSKFIIKGPSRLAGTFQPVGNKNAALPMIAAALLTEEPVTLNNVPRIVDVQVMLDLLASLGATVEQKGSRVTLRAAKLRKRRLDPVLCAKVRSSILFAGPLAARHGRAILSPPGGDGIGRRRIDTHVYGLRALGIAVEGGRSWTFRRKQLRGTEILMDEASVTATENVLMAAVLADGVTTIFNAACEPHVQDLGNLLNKMGARIEGLGTNLIRIEGVPSLHGATHDVGPDYIELGSFLAAAAATHGELIAENFDGGPRYMDVLQKSFGRLGVAWTTADGRLTLSARQKLRVQRDLGQAIPKIEDGPWPAFPSDLMSVALVLATQAKGTMLFFEKMFESRMYFVDRLIEMGAHIIQCDPHRVIVTGASRLHSMTVSTPDIRAGMSMIVAALCAKGETVIENAQIIDRGYERIDERLRALGADIVRAS